MVLLSFSQLVKANKHPAASIKLKVLICKQIKLKYLLFRFSVTAAKKKNRPVKILQKLSC